MYETPETCQNCTYYASTTDDTGTCSYPTIKGTLRVTSSHRCPSWYPSIRAAVQSEITLAKDARAIVNDARAIVNDLMGN